MNFSSAEMECLASPLFDAFRGLADSAATNQPVVSSLATYNRLASEKGLIGGGGQPIQFVPPAFEKDSNYEVKIFLSGAIETRVTVKHDLLNAWVWLTFPQAKAAVNAGHYHALQARSPQAHRSGIEDALTLLDENGAVVVCSDPELVALLKNAQWKNVFWQQRVNTLSRMRIFLFGHGLLEKALHPYVGMCAHSVIFLVQTEFFSLDLTDQLKSVDQLLAYYLAKLGPDFNTRALTAVPLLGFPGYFADNTAESFYDNLDYFRPKETAQKKESA